MPTEAIIETQKVLIKKRATIKTRMTLVEKFLYKLKPSFESDEQEQIKQATFKLNIRFLEFKNLLLIINSDQFFC